MLLKVHCLLHADLAPECASAYHHYGTAIFYKAQEEQDVFGAPLQQAAAEAQEEEEEAEVQENGAAIAKGELQLFIAATDEI